MKRLIFIFLLCSLANAQNLEQEFAGIMKPTIGKPVQLPNYVSFGGLVLQLSESTKAWQLLANGEPCGVIFDGTDVLALTVTNKFSIPLAKHNITRTAEPLRHKMSIGEGKLEVSDRLERGILWSWQYANAPVVEGEAPSSSLVNWLDTMTEARYDVIPGHELLNGKYNKRDDVMVGLFKMYTGHYLYNYDPSREKLQSFFYLEKLKRSEGVVEEDLIGTWVSYRLTAEPIGRRWWDGSPANLVTTHTKLDVNNTKGESIVVSSSLRLKATQDNQSLWRANLAEGRRELQKLYKINVQKVSIDGQDVSFVHRNDYLLVHLGRALKRGEEVVVDVVCSGDFALKYRGQTYWRLGNIDWYPRSDLSGQYSTLDLTLRVPKKLEPFASGNLISRDEDGTHVIIKTSYDKPFDNFFVAAGPYHQYSTEQNGLICRAGNLGVKKKKGVERLQKNFFVSADYFEQMYGLEYPFKTLSMVELDGYGYGQAPPGMIFLTNEAFQIGRQKRQEFFSGGVNSRVAHEVAHGFWGHVIKMEDYEEQWLTEGLAEYSAALFMKAVMGKRGKAEFKQAVGHWKGYALNADRVSVYLANYLSFYPGDGDTTNRNHLLYSKGPYIIHAIRGELQQKFGVEEGDRKFSIVLRSFAKNFQFRWGGTRHFIEILNQVTGDDWQPYFEKYVFGTEMPVAKVKV